MSDKQKPHKPERKADNEWEKIWNDIYEFQRTLLIDTLHYQMAVYQAMKNGDNTAEKT